jgi:hypothetical protein
MKTKSGESYAIAKALSLEEKRPCRLTMAIGCVPLVLLPSLSQTTPWGSSYFLKASANNEQIDASMYTYVPSRGKGSNRNILGDKLQKYRCSLEVFHWQLNQVTIFFQASCR